MDAAFDAGSASAGIAPDHGMETARAQEYALLARLLLRAPDQAFLSALGGLDDGGGPLGQAHAALGRAARAAEPAALAREHFTLFVGVGRGELLPYASFYRTGFLNERPLAELRRDLAALGLARADGLHEPEDHMALLCDAMAALAHDAAADGADERQGGFFRRHLEPWAAEFFDDLAAAPSADFYRAVGGLGAAFMAIEAKAFAMEA